MSAVGGCSRLRNLSMANIQMMTTDEILRLDVPFPRESLGVRWDAYNDWVREEGWVPTIEREEQLEGRLCYFGRRRIPNEAEELAERPPYYSESVGANV